MTRELRQYDVLNVETDKVGDDLTGTRILADRPVAVFGGNKCAVVPNTARCIDNPAYDPGDPASPEMVCEQDAEVACAREEDCEIFYTCCCDHLEQQMFPVKTWGLRYLATFSWERGRAPDTWRVMAAEDGTQVATLPPQATIPVLNRGEWFEFESKVDFEVQATQPVLVGHYLQGQHAPVPGSHTGDAKIGDPAFYLTVPIEQYRDSYVFLAPDKYAEDFVNVIAPVDAAVQIDGVEIQEGTFEVFGTGEYKVARMFIRDGVHRVDADAPVGVVVYGYDQYVSYGYPGGLNLTELNQEPEDL